jgi:hypothetical protein
MRAAKRRGLMAALLMILAAGPAAATQPAATAEALAFDRFLALTNPVCEQKSSVLCVDTAWRAVDRDGDKRLGLAEFQGIRGELLAWLTWKGQGLPAAQRRMIQLGLLVVDGIGLPALVDSYDADGDGAISRAELLTDVSLDARPLGQVLLDAKAVDWEALSRRLGPMAATITGLGKPQ